MNQLTVKCPQCQCEVSIDDALRHQIQDQLKKELSSDVEAEKKMLREQMAEWQDKEKKKLESQVQELTAKAKEEVAAESKNLKEELEAKEKLLLEEKEKREAAEKLELDLRKKAVELEDRERKLELEKQRQLDEEREKIRTQAATEQHEKDLMRMAEMEKHMDGLKKQLEDAHFKANLQSQQLQGEVQELEIEERLRAEFPSDEIVEVAKGVKGADIVQKVFDLNTGTLSGVIVWESKRTYKNWDKAWIMKLKEDAIKVGADAAVIVSNTLPESVKSFALQEGVLISSFECLTYIGQLLREQIIRYKQLEMSNVGKDKRMEGLYNYLRSNQFKHHVESIADAWTMMRKQVDDERRVYERQWAAREKALERVMVNTMGMYGDIQGLMGSALPELDGFGVTSLLEEPEVN